MDATIEKVSIIVSKGSLEGIYPALIMANGARAEGIEANLFFTFFGLDAVTKKRHEHIKVATVGNPGLHLATIVGSLPGMPGLMTGYLGHKMAKLDIPPIPEFIEMISDSGAGLYGCQASCDLFGISKDDLIEQVQGIITVGDFYAKTQAQREVARTARRCEAAGSKVAYFPVNAVLAVDAQGNVFGTTYSCGKYGKGTVWQVSP